MSELSFGSASDYPTWTPPRFTPTTIPTLPSLSLTDDEKALISHLQSRCQVGRRDMELTNAYYMGSQTLKNLEVAIPRELAEKLRTLVGWAAQAVDPYVDRLHVEGFRLPGKTQADETLGRVWALNGLDAEESLAYTDALAMRQAWWLVGSNPDDPSTPLVTVESPLNVAAQWDLSGRRIKALLQTYTQDEQQRATFMLPDRTITIAQNEKGEWEKVGQPDQHNFGWVTAARMANRPRTDNRDGSSEITAALMSLIDSACRRLMGLEASSELYSVPRMLILGANAEDFTSANGQARKAWDAYISKINVLENDPEGNAPSVQQLAVYDPSVFTKVVEMYAAQAAGLVNALPQDLGLYTQGNPPSVESLDAMESRRNRHARTMQQTFGVAHVAVQQMALRYLNKGKLPDEYRRIEVDWTPPELVSFSATADAVVKLTSGDNPVLPARSDVVLKRLGLSAVERAQVELDRAEQVQGDVVAALNAASASARQVTDGPGVVA